MKSSELVSSETGIIFDISHYMIEDGPGIRTNVFMKGCPLRCKWCSNAYGLSKEIQLGFNQKKCTACARCVDVCPESAISFSGPKILQDFEKCKNCFACIDACAQGARHQIGRKYTVDEVIKEIKKDQMFYRRGGGGVTISGGELLMQHGFVIQLLKKCESEYISTAIETSAFGDEAALKEIIRYTDVIFIDCKHMNSEKHKELTGVSNELILKNIKAAAIEAKKHDKVMVLRLPLIPSINDYDKNIIETGLFANEMGLELNILPYHDFGTFKYDHIGLEYSLNETERPSDKLIKHVSGLLEKIGAKYSIGGYDVESY